MAVAVAGCVNFGPQGHGGVGGGTNVGVEDPLPPAPRVALDAGSFVTLPDGGVTTGLGCFFRDVLPADCDLAGAWRLLHAQPIGVCPFGASRHDIRLAQVGGQLCIEPGEDFQLMQPGPSGACAIVISGRHDVGAAAVPYTESWTGQLTFTGDTGSGETVVAVSGGNNCTRKFQTTIDRK